MKKLLFATVLLAGAVFAQPRVSVGVGIGVGGGGFVAAAPPALRHDVRRPRMPGRGYVWVDGYYNFVRGRYVYVPGYWARPPYAGAYWVAPRYDGRRYFDGYWEHARDNRGPDNRNGYRR